MSRNGLYILEAETIVGYADPTSEQMDKTRLWHLRLGDVSGQGLTELNKQNVLCGHKMRELELCE